MSQEMTIKLFMSGPEPTCINFKTFQEIVKYLTKVIDSHENMSSLEIRLLPVLRGDRSSHLEDGVKKVMSTGSLTKRKSIYHVEHGSFSVEMSIISSGISHSVRCGRLPQESEFVYRRSMEQKEPKQTTSSSTRTCQDDVSSSSVKEEMPKPLNDESGMSE